MVQILNLPVLIIRIYDLAACEKDPLCTNITTNSFNHCRSRNCTIRASSTRMFNSTCCTFRPSGAFKDLQWKFASMVLHKDCVQVLEHLIRQIVQWQRTFWISHLWVENRDTLQRTSCLWDWLSRCGSVDTSIWIDSNERLQKHC